MESKKAKTTSFPKQNPITVQSQVTNHQLQLQSPPSLISGTNEKPKFSIGIPESTKRIMEEMRHLLRLQRRLEKELEEIKDEKEALRWELEFDANTLVEEELMNRQNAKQNARTIENPQPDEDED